MADYEFIKSKIGQARTDKESVVKFGFDVHAVLVAQHEKGLQVGNKIYGRFKQFLLKTPATKIPASDEGNGDLFLQTICTNSSFVSKSVR